jgi:hypothetical protein
MAFDSKKPSSTITLLKLIIYCAPPNDNPARQKKYVLAERKAPVEGRPHC